MKKDIVVGCIDLYEFDSLKNWIYSLNESGFDGRKILVCYRISDETKQQIKDNGVEVISVNTDHNGHPLIHPAPGEVPPTKIFQTRFFHLWQMLKEIGVENVNRIVATDVNDIIFQNNPSTWMDENMGEYSILGGSEGIKYKDETNWGAQNITDVCGPYVYQYMMQDKTIVNAGSMAGRADIMMDLFLTIYFTTFTTTLNNTDQAAFNFLFNTTLLEDKIKCVQSEEGWACQAGTFSDPNRMHIFRPNLLEPEPVFRDGKVYTAGGKEYCIVHQYNRVPEWNNVINERYNK